jgi:hypothetical protein
MAESSTGCIYLVGILLGSEGLKDYVVISRFQVILNRMVVLQFTLFIFVKVLNTLRRCFYKCQFVLLLA